jgi:glycosyltransferase involved in cell wall biosynthesis
MDRTDRPFRIGFVLSTALGNATRYRILRQFAEDSLEFECVWAPVKHFYSADEHDPVKWVKGPLRSRAVVIAQSMPVLRELSRLDAVVVHQLEVQPILNVLRSIGRAPPIFAAQDNPPMIEAAGYPICYPEFADKSPFRRRARGALDVAIARATQFHVVFSKWQGDILRSHASIAQNRILVGHCGLDQKAWPAPVSEKPDGLPRILFVGGDFERKGGPQLLRVFQDYLQGLALLDVVTQTPVDCDIPGVTIYNGLTNATPQLRNLFNGATILAHPTRADFLPWVCLEAMACGLPVVATNVGGVPDVVENDLNGYIVPEGDDAALAAALLRLVRDPDQAKKMGKNGRLRVEREFDAAHNVPVLLDQIRTAVRVGAFSKTSVAA